MQKYQRRRSQAADQGGDHRVPEDGRRQVRGVPRRPARVVPRRIGDDAAGRDAADEEPLRDAARREGARDAPSRPADDDPADDRPGAAPDPPDAGADGADAGRRDASRRGNWWAQSPVSARNARVPARAEAQQPARVVQPRKERVRRAGPRADDSPSSSGWRTTFTRSRRRSSSTRRRAIYRIYRDTRFSENKTPYKTHIAAVFPWRGPGEARGRRPLLSRVARRGVDRRRHVRAADAAAAGGARAHRRPTPGGCARSSSRRDFAAMSAQLEGERLQRVPRGFPKDHPAAEYPEVSPVPRRPRAAARVPPAARSSTPRCSRCSVTSRRSHGSSTNR